MKSGYRRQLSVYRRALQDSRQWAAFLIVCWAKGEQFIFLKIYIIFFSLLDIPSGLWTSLWGSAITRRPTALGSTPLDKWSVRRRDLYLTTHNTQNIKTSTTPAGLETRTPPPPSKRAAADLHLRPRGHRHRLKTSPCSKILRLICKSLILIHVNGLAAFRYQLSSCVEEQTCVTNLRIKNSLKIFDWKIERKYILWGVYCNGPRGKLMSDGGLGSLIGLT
jgi:hypothetical protein